MKLFECLYTWDRDETPCKHFTLIQHCVRMCEHVRRVLYWATNQSQNNLCLHDKNPHTGSCSSQSEETSTVYYQQHYNRNRDHAKTRLCRSITLCQFRVNRALHCNVIVQLLNYELNNYCWINLTAMEVLVLGKSRETESIVCETNTCAT